MGNIVQNTNIRSCQSIIIIGLPGSVAILRKYKQPSSATML